MIHKSINLPTNCIQINVIIIHQIVTHKSMKLLIKYTRDANHGECLVMHRTAYLQTRDLAIDVFLLRSFLSNSNLGQVSF